jgi:hypothetical protein
VRWIKRGLIFRTDHHHDWMAHHACVPIAEHVGPSVLRIYFGPRDSQGLTRPTFIEVDADQPTRVLYVHDKPLLDLGRLGTFDDSGVMPSCIVDDGERKLLFYVGWNRTVTVPYRNSIGLAESHDGGLTFTRVCEGPIVDRTADEPFLAASPFALLEDGKWKLWYASGTGWLVVDGRPEPTYEIKYAESADAVRWQRDNATCIRPKLPGEANARPCVLKEDGVYRMWYCYRGSVGYRTDPTQSYRLGYAESADGRRWTRLDEEVGIERSASGWDAGMLAYPFVYHHRGRKHLLYNGNGFGESGFGYAVLE